MELTFKTLQEAVRGTACAFRCRCQLQPAGGPGDKVFPPTYAGAVYAKEQRRVPGCNDAVECVLLDSVQSQANRMEDALQAAVDQGRLTIPVIEVDFGRSSLPVPIGKVTSLQAPHRIADAILRDSLLDDVSFRKTELGQSLDAASIHNATPLYRLCPTALILGMWDSTGPKGGMGVKFQRAMVSEIVGIDAVFGVKTSSRIDPLQVTKNAGPLFRTPDGGWTLDQQAAIREENKLVLYKKDKGKDVLWDPQTDAGKIPDQGRPSVANHGNRTPDIDYRRDPNGRLVYDGNGSPIAVGGVTLTQAEQLTVLSLPALRRLHFPIPGKSKDEQIRVDAAGQTVLAALGLCAAALAGERGLDLRSRCLLWPTETMEWELLDRPGQTPANMALTADNAIAVLNDAVAAAEEIGLSWRTEPLVLMPSPQLVELVRRSQELAAVSAGTEEG
ncbi:MAG: type I-U CRISPR-associated protein Cas7 [Phycisphaerae bacterium]|nr:type I-U CRISPR-associated protein Cas7 [Phycisphaerae bacterium]